MQTVALRAALSLVIVAAITLICGRLLSVNATTAGFAFLIGVLWIATTWGMIEAVLASLAAMFCFNMFFLPPIGRMTIADPQNWIALFAFLVTALVASHLSDKAKNQALEARNHQRDTEQLYALSRSILLSHPDHSMGRQVALQIARIFNCPAVAVYDAPSGEVYPGGSEDLPGIEPKLKQVVLQATTLHEPGAGLVVAPVTLGGRPIGSLALSRITLPDGALQALLNLVAIALERVRSEETTNRAEVARQSEEFKSTLLDAIAHEFKTPLTSIKAASTSLLSEAGSLPLPMRELAAIIDEETDRLSLLVSDAVRMAQIDAGKVRLERRPVSIRDLCDGALVHFGQRLEGRILSRHISDNLPLVLVDKDLIQLALRQLIDNALKYSAPASPLDLGAELEGNRVLILLRDRGPGIPEKYLDRIFDKFYRKEPAKQRVPGSGLGLHIAREIVRAHGGDLWAKSEPGQGSEFCMALAAPRESDEA
jgi:two-component system, OmpR family, sensor histidine kinase KdpD